MPFQVMGSFDGSRNGICGNLHVLSPEIEALGQPDPHKHNDFFPHTNPP
jgi:hypothetical protein